MIKNNKFNDDEPPTDDSPVQIKKFYFSKEEKLHLARLRKKIKIKAVKYLIDDIITFKDKPQYIILKNMYPKIK